MSTYIRYLSSINRVVRRKVIICNNTKQSEPVPIPIPIPIPIQLPLPALVPVLVLILVQIVLILNNAPGFDMVPYRTVLYI